MITEEQLAEDVEIYWKMKHLQEKSHKLTLEEEKEFKALHHKYYVENDNIRIYWKTY